MLSCHCRAGERITGLQNPLTSSNINMLNANDALNQILGATPGVSSEKIKIMNGLARTAARDVIASENIPAFNNSSMDGYAVRFLDTTKATARKPVILSVVGEARAGAVFAKKLKPGETVRIMTGGKIPDGADAVIPIEHVAAVDKQHHHISRKCRKGEHVRFAGEDIKKGDTLLHKGELISPATLATLASLGIMKIRVARKPLVKIIATGDELVAFNDTPKAGQIRNSTSLALRAFVEQAGGDAKLLGIVPDKKKRLRKAIKSSLKSDVLVITGGVSVGRYDLVKEVLEKRGAKIRFWRVNIKPGKPLLFATLGKTLIFGLPGNPASTAVTFLQFVRPAMWKMQGRLLTESLRVLAVFDGTLRKNDGKRHFVRGIVSRKKNRLVVKPAGIQSSGAMSPMARANCLIIIPEKVRSLKKGSAVEIELL